MIIDQFKKAISEGKPLFIKSHMDYNFVWDDVIDLIDKAHNNPIGDEVPEDTNSPLVYNHNFKKLTSLKIPTGGLTFHAEDILSSGYDLKSKKYDIIKNMKYSLMDLDPDSTVHAKFSINLSTGSPRLHPHRDSHHVLLTQVIGDATYIIHDSEESDPYGKQINVGERPFKEYHLQKNDILFMPKGTIHSIDNSSIRVACIFDIIKKHDLN